MQQTDYSKDKIKKGIPLYLRKRKDGLVISKKIFVIGDGIGGATPITNKNVFWYWRKR